MIANAVLQTSRSVWMIFRRNAMIHTHRSATRTKAVAMTSSVNWTCRLVIRAALTVQVVQAESTQAAQSARNVTQNVQRLTTEQLQVATMIAIREMAQASRDTWIHQLKVDSMSDRALPAQTQRFNGTREPLTKHLVWTRKLFGLRSSQKAAAPVHGVDWMIIATTDSPTTTESQLPFQQRNLSIHLCVPISSSEATQASFQEPVVLPTVMTTHVFKHELVCILCFASLFTSLYLRNWTFFRLYPWKLEIKK